MKERKEQKLTNQEFENLLEELKIKEEAKEKIRRVWNNDPSLTSLYLEHSNLGPEEAKLIANALKENDSLTRLYLWNNELGPKGEAIETNQIRPILKRNKSLHQELTKELLSLSLVNKTFNKEIKRKLGLDFSNINLGELDNNNTLSLNKLPSAILQETINYLTGDKGQFKSVTNHYKRNVVKVMRESKAKEAESDGVGAGKEEAETETRKRKLEAGAEEQQKEKKQELSSPSNSPRVS